MPGVSSKTELVTVRLPVEVVRTVERNARKGGVSVSEYLRKIVTVQVMRRR